MLIRRLLFLAFFSLNSLSQAQKLNVSVGKKPSGASSLFGRLTLDSLSNEGRDQQIRKWWKSGQIPSFAKEMVPVTYTEEIAGKVYKVTLFVSADYFCVGNEDDYAYLPLTATLAQEFATEGQALLPTRKMVNHIYEQAAQVFIPQPIPPSPQMTTPAQFLRHDRMIKEQLAEKKQTYRPGQLTAGHKKDVVISPQIYRDGKAFVVIYGWHQLNGKPIQPLYGKHLLDWVDYSHGIRFIHSRIQINGKWHLLKNILKDPVLHVLVSDEGPFSIVHYPSS